MMLFVLVIPFVFVGIGLVGNVAGKALGFLFVAVVTRLVYT